MIKTHITSAENKAVKYAVKIRDSAKFRREEGLFFCEGQRLCFDAVKCSCPIDTLFVTEEFLSCEKEFRHIESVSSAVYTVSKEIMKKLCDTVTPQGIAALVKIPQEKEIPTGFKLLVALEKTQDPKNLGAIARSAEAFGADGIIISDTTCDPYSPKSLRAGMGAMFRIPIFKTDSFCDILNALKSNGAEILVSVVSGDAEDVRALPQSKKRVLVIGNEANGVSDDTISLASKCITIPMYGNAESLNASTAATVLIWECVRGEKL